MSLLSRLVPPAPRRLARAAFLALLAPAAGFAAQIASADLYQVVDIPFTGPQQGPTDTPASIDFWVKIRHSSGSPTYKIYGYWDGDGQGGTSGNVFKVRFAGTKSGTWTLIETNAPGTTLHDQRENDTISVSATADSPGFWTVDTTSANGGWFKRDDGSHPYIIGTTYYDFLHKPADFETTPANIVSDINAAAQYFNKVRIGVSAPYERNDDANLRPFFTSTGAAIDTETDRPNPAFFHHRVDAAVKRAAELDLIIDLIIEMEGDTSGTTQLATNTRFHKYVAARYGAYAQVWFCLGNEADEQNGGSVINTAGASLASYLAYPNPVSVHNLRGWKSDYSGTWYTHTINQHKINDHLTSDGSAGNLGLQADKQISEFNKSNALRPVINDECAYDPGEASEVQTLESVVGCLMGGAYASTGNKIAGSKSSPYFEGYAARGTWTISNHSSADNLGWFRPLVDQYLELERLSPSTPSIFGGLPSTFRALAWSGNQYVLGSNGDAGGASLTAALPAGTWSVRQLNLVSKTNTLLTSSASGTYSFTTPASKAAVTIFTKVSGGTAPAAPSDLAGAGVSSSQINLTWKDNSSNESTFRLERRSVWTTVATVSPDTTFYADSSGLSADTTYEYRLRAENDVGSSSYTAVATATTLATDATLITAPAVGVTFTPKQSVTLTGTGTSLSWSVTGAATATGTGTSIAFTIPAAATNNSTVTATLTGAVGSDTRSWTIVDTAPVISTTSAQLAAATVGAAYSDDLEASGGEGPITIALSSGSLPPGLSISGNLLTGTPTTAGSYAFSITATDDDGDVSAPVSLSLNVSGGGASTSATFAAAADTYISSAATTTNYGSATTVAVGSDRLIYLRFTISGLPAGATITDATLRLRCTNNSVTTGGYIRSLVPSTAAWSESTPTWSAPLSGTESSTYSTLGPVSSGTDYTFTSLKGAITGNGEVTFVIRSAATDGAAYASDEATTASTRPVLTVTYTP